MHYWLCSLKCMRQDGDTVSAVIPSSNLPNTRKWTKTSMYRHLEMWLLHVKKLDISRVVYTILTLVSDEVYDNRIQPVNKIIPRFVNLTEMLRMARMVHHTHLQHAILYCLPYLFVWTFEGRVWYILHPCRCSIVWQRFNWVGSGLIEV